MNMNTEYLMEAALLYLFSFMFSPRHKGQGGMSEEYSIWVVHCNHFKIPSSENKEKNSITFLNK